MKKILHFFAFLLLSTFSILAQPSYDWTINSATGSGSNYSNAVGVDNAGNVYTAGAFTGTADLDPSATVLNYNSAGGSDIFVSKYNASGALLWTYPIGGSGADNASGIYVSGAGDVYVTGSFTGTVDFDPSPNTSNLVSSGSIDIFVLKITSAGVFSWAKKMGGTGDDAGYGVAVDGAGNVNITGTFSGTANFNPAGTFNLTAVGSFECFVVQLSSAGAFNWAFSIGGSQVDVGHAITTDNSNNIYITGRFSQTADFDPSAGVQNRTSGGNADIFVAKYSSTGAYSWAKAYAGTGSFDDRGIAISVRNGEVAVAGHMRGTVDFDGLSVTFIGGTGSAGNAFTLKLSDTGVRKWVKRVGNATEVRATGVQLDDIGAVYTVGAHKNSFDADPDAGVVNLIGNGGSVDAFIQKLDSVGNFIWAYNYAGTGNDEVSGITTDNLNNLYLSGFFQTTVDFNPLAGTDNLLASGLADGFVQKLGQCATAFNPSAILGTASALCIGTTYTYSIPSVAGATSYQWTLPNGWTGTSTTNAISATVGASSGSISVIAQGACGGSNPSFLSVSVLAPPATPTSIAGPTTTCQGLTETYTTPLISGATSYIWTLPNGFVGTSSTNSINVTFNTSVSGSISVRSSNCSPSAAFSLFVTVLPAPTVNITPNNPNVCTGQSVTLTANASIGIGGGFNYIWSNGGGNSLSATFSPASNTTYYVTVTSSTNNCSKIDSSIVTVVGAASAAISGPSTLCSGDTLTLTASGGGTYTWSNGGGSNAQAKFTPTTSSTVIMNYTVTVSNGSCSATSSKQVTVSAKPTAAISPATVAICAGESATLTASGGGTYAWSNSGGSNAAATFSPTANTTYTVTVTNAASCSATASRLVTVNANPTASITPASVTICEGQSASLTASGGGTYAWSNSGGSNAQASFSPISNTTYTVTVTNASNCSATASRLITVNSTPTVAISPSTVSICAGQNVTLTASGGGTYNWSNSGGANAQATFSPTANISYTVTVTNANNCSATATRAVAVNPLPTAAINGPSTICSGLSATLTASGGGTYAWSNAATSSSTTVTPTAATTYTVTVTNNSCTATASQTVSVQSTPTAVINGASSVCAGSSLTLTANGGNTYSWSNGLGSNAAITVSPTATTTYTVTASLGAGCTATATQTVTIKQATSGSIAQTICAGQSIVFNGITRNQSGSYRDTLVNVAGCDSFLTLNLTVRPQITGNISRTVCFGESFVFNGQTLTQNGNYRDTLTASNGCDSILALNFTVRPRIASIQSQSICNGSSITFNGQTITQAGQYLDTLMSVAGCDSFITLNVSLGQSSASTKADTICNGASYIFGTQTLTQGGTYTRAIQNIAGCDSVITLSLFVRPAVSVSVTKSGNTLSASAGFASYQWKLNGTNIPSANAQTYTATANGNYTVQVTDANGCSATSAITNVTGVGIDDITEIAVSIYPSPASERLYISTTEAIESVEITDMLGRKVLSSDHVNEQIDISSLSSSRYMISLKTAKGIQRISFVKE